MARPECAELWRGSTYVVDSQISYGAWNLECLFGNCLTWRGGRS
jgi:hypothetical protein